MDFISFRVENKVNVFMRCMYLSIAFLFFINKKRGYISQIYIGTRTRVFISSCITLATLDTFVSHSNLWLFPVFSEIRRW